MIVLFEPDSRWPVKIHSGNGRALKLAVLGGAALASAAAGVLFFINRTASSDRHMTGTIQLTRHGAGCQRLVIDNATDTIKSSQQVPCDSPAKQVTQPIEGAPSGHSSAPSRYSSGGRVDAVRDSFRSR